MSKAKVLGGLAGAIALAAVALVMPFEGKHNAAYLDPPGIPTICYGHTGGVKLGNTATDGECYALLKEDLAEADAAVQRLVKTPLPEPTRAALISFVYNVGAGAFAASNAREKINAGDMRGGCEALATKKTDKNGLCRGYGCGWSGGKMLKGLQIRRAAERDLCLKGVSP